MEAKQIVKRVFVNRGFVKKTLIIAFLPMLMMGNLLGCADEFDDVTLVEKFRVLAVSVNPPEIRPEHVGPVEMKVLWSDPNGQQRPVSFAWVLCMGQVPAGTGYEYCELLDPALPPVVGAAAEGGDSYTIPMVSPQAFAQIPSGESLDATAIVLLCAGGMLPPAEQLMNFKSEPNIAGLCKGGDGLVANKGIKIANGDAHNDPANTVPVIESLSLWGPTSPESVQGDPLTPIELADTVEQARHTVRCSATNSCDKKFVFGAVFTQGSYQPFTEIRFDEVVKMAERPFIVWFATGGELQGKFSMSQNPQDYPGVGWIPGKPGLYNLWAVANDNRGGISWQSYQIKVE